MDGPAGGQLLLWGDICHIIVLVIDDLLRGLLGQLCRAIPGRFTGQLVVIVELAG